jgi:hypothetical protein
MHQVVSRPTAIEETRVRLFAIPLEICVGQGGTGVGFSRLLPVFLISMMN